MSTLRQPGVLAWLHLARSFKKMQRREAGHLRCYHLTTAQFDVLAHLSAHPGVTQQELGERLLVTKGNVCGLVDRLAVAGLVERRPDPNDRRANHMFLTPVGEALACKVVPAHEAFIQAEMMVLDASEQRALLGLMRRLDRGLSLK